MKDRGTAAIRNWLSTYDFNIALTLSFNRKIKPYDALNLFDKFCGKQDRKHFGRYFYRKKLGIGRPLAIGFIENKRRTDEKLFTNREYETQLREFKQADRKEAEKNGKFYGLPEQSPVKENTHIHLAMIVPDGKEQDYISTSIPSLFSVWRPGSVEAEMIYYKKGWINYISKSIEQDLEMVISKRKIE